MMDATRPTSRLNMINDTYILSFPTIHPPTAISCAAVGVQIALKRRRLNEQDPRRKKTLSNFFDILVSVCLSVCLLVPSLALYSTRKKSHGGVTYAAAALSLYIQVLVLCGIDVAAAIPEYLYVLDKKAMPLYFFEPQEGRDVNTILYVEVGRQGDRQVDEALMWRQATWDRRGRERAIHDDDAHIHTYPPTNNRSWQPKLS